MSETAFLQLGLETPGTDLKYCLIIEDNRINFHKTIDKYTILLRNAISKLELIRDIVPETEIGSVDLRCSDDGSVEIMAPIDVIDILEQCGVAEVYTDDDEGDEDEEDDENEGDDDENGDENGDENEDGGDDDNNSGKKLN